MAYFASSVTVDESLDKVVEYTNDDDHVRTLVSTVEGRPTAVTEWQRIGDRIRHRVEWKADIAHGWLEVHREGYAASVSVGVHTDAKEGADARLDAALLALKEGVEAVDAADIRKADHCNSFVIRTVLKGLVRAIPAAQRSAMAPFLEQTRTVDGADALEHLRADVCSAWARDAAERRRRGIGRVKAVAAEEVAHVTSNVDAGLVEAERRTVDEAAKLERFDPQWLGEGDVPAGFHHRLNEVYEALREAHRIATHSGWDEVGWPDLLDRLFAVGPH